ncbi:hypothetical protein BDW59DRAFT_155384 [Aspergillus cavernicola]|uniref:Zn(II)2Cys6 transcription factor n=1 Tax=Aspergillus cavernicola TaxID=176166 RepID=A0ABR4H9A4_9EURO
MSSNFREGCTNTYFVLIGLDVPSSGANPNILDESQLCKLVEALGTDLDDIRKLMRDQVVHVINTLREAGIVNCFAVQPEEAPVVVDASVPSENHDPELSQYTPSVVSPLLTSDCTLSSDVNPPHAGKEFDIVLNGFGMPSPGVPNMANTPCPDLVATPVSVTSHGPDAGASSYPTPPHSVNSPPSDQPLYQAVDALRSTHGSQRQQQQQTIFKSLQSCKFGGENVSLTDAQVRCILKAEPLLLSRDLLGILQPLFNSKTNMSFGLNKLGLPEEWGGIGGGVNYLRVLDADKAKENPSSLSPLVRRVAQILLYLNYERLCMHGETEVVARILHAYHDDPNKSKGERFRRNNFSAFHVRRGRWWWRLAARLGFGIILVAEELVRSMHSDRFAIHQIDAFITFILHTRPGTVRLFHSLESLAISLLRGVVPANLVQIVLDDNTGLLSQDALTRAHYKDQDACQQITNPWMVENNEHCADEKMNSFLALLYEV